MTVTEKLLFKNTETDDFERTIILRITQVLCNFTDEATIGSL